jgi:hypothetical protein
MAPVGRAHRWPKAQLQKAPAKERHVWRIYWTEFWSGGIESLASCSFAGASGFHERAVSRNQRLNTRIVCVKHQCKGFVRKGCFTALPLYGRGEKGPIIGNSKNGWHKESFGRITGPAQSCRTDQAAIV